MVYPSTRTNSCTEMTMTTLDIQCKATVNDFNFLNKQYTLWDQSIKFANERDGGRRAVDKDLQLANNSTDCCKLECCWCQCHNGHNHWHYVKCIHIDAGRIFWHLQIEHAEKPICHSNSQNSHLTTNKEKNRCFQKTNNKQIKPYLH